ncbi:MAG: hypothetical protein IPF57_12835 [Gammaproteobacteria bacterium]|jgi:hypothetical protein|nr:hypothetical protein [Gammaproteobacteria bacterium]MBK8993486.1 hypothetical protein [Gammaproteobacteria bacterium]
MHIFHVPRMAVTAAMLIALAGEPAALADDITSDESRAALGAELDAQLRADLQEFPLYLNEDANGKLYRIALERTKEGTYTSEQVPVTDDELKELESIGHRILITPDGQLPRSIAIAEGDASSMAVSSTCPLPANFNMSGLSNGQAYGSQYSLTSNRPAGTSTQWVVFEFYTKNYRGMPIHSPITLFYDDVLQGWGGFFGNNSGAYDPQGNYVGCGSTALFNSQIEGWYQLPGWAPPPGTPGNANWRSKTFNGSNSCGNEMYDGWPYANPYYRITMHANTGKWVGYQIEQKVSGVWQILTPWKSLQVTSAPWPWIANPPVPSVPPLDSSNEGIRISTTDGAPNWIVFVKNLDCGWF